MDTNNELIKKLARSCAHGHAQLGLINELIAGPARIALFEIPGVMRGTTLKYGHSKVGSQSFKSLKTRLLANGFYFIIDQENTRLQLRYGG